MGGERMPETERGKWWKAMTGKGNVSPIREGERTYTDEPLKGRNKKVSR